MKGNAKEFAELMVSMDKDGNGYIDYTEFITAAIDKTVILNRDNLLTAFKMLDADNSGMITVDELKAAFDAHGDKDDEVWKEIMQEVDKNGDNQISLEEFMDVMTDLLKKKSIQK
jgi:calcium-dependent protein kinase